MFPAKRALTGVVMEAAGGGSLYLGGDPMIAGTLIAAGATLQIAPTAWWWYRSRHGIVAMKNRAARRADKTEGYVGFRERFAESSKWAMRKRWGRKLRPDLFNVNGPAAIRWAKQWWRLLFIVPVEEYAVNLGRDNFGGYWVPLNSVVTRLAAARSGKSVAMASRIVDHRGPAVVTSVRKDLLLLTAQLRARRGQLFIFNPGDIAHLASNLKWSVLSGCTDMSTAERRATQLIGQAANSEERDYWNDQAWRVLAPLMYAAAHAKLPMRAVQRWIAAGAQEAKDARLEIVEILMKTPEGGAQVHNLNQFFSMVGPGDRTRLSITNTIAQVLKWLGNPRMAALGDAQGDGLFNIRQDLLDTAATVYILGAENRTSSALTGCLVAEIVYQATQYAETLPPGKLTPPMLLSLDEAALTIPGQSLPEWTTYLGGSGITLDIGAQQRSRLDMVWGEKGRQTILGNSSAVLVGAGCNDPRELQDYELMSGKRDVPQRDAKGNIMPAAPRREVPVVSVQNLKELPIGKVVCYPRGPVTRLDTPNAENERRVRRAGRYEPPADAETSYEADAREKLREEEQV